MKEKVRIWIAVFCCSVAWLYGAYSPVFWIPFAHHDDYYLFAYDDRSTIKNHPLYRLINAIGRYGHNVLAGPLYRMIHEVGDLAYLRVISLIAFAIYATSLFQTFFRAGFGRLTAFFLTASIFVLPGAQYVFGYAIAGVGALAIGPALIASYLTRKLPLPKTHLEVKSPATWKTWSYFIGAFLALFLSICIYPAWTAFYLVPPLIGYASPAHGNLSVARRQVYIHLIIFTTCALAYFFLQTFLLKPLWYPDMKLGHYELAITSQLWDRCTVFILTTLPRILNMYKISTETWPAILGGLVLTIGTMATCFEAPKRNGGDTSFARFLLHDLFIKVLVLGAACLPVIAPSSYHSEYRLMWVPQVVILCLAATGLYWCLVLIAKKAQAVLLLVLAGLFVGLGTLSASANANKVAADANLEISYIKLRVLQETKYFPSLPQIHIVMPTEKCYAMTSLGIPTDEWGLSTAFWADVPWMVRAVLIDLRAKKGVVPPIIPLPPSHLTETALIQAQAKGLIVSSSHAGQRFPLLPGALVIDMNDICGLRNAMGLP